MLRWLEADPDLRDTTHIFADEVPGWFDVACKKGK